MKRTLALSGITATTALLAALLVAAPQAGAATGFKHGADDAVPSASVGISDDGPLHDLGDDHGVDGPLHDVGDDHGGLRGDIDIDDDGIFNASDRDIDGDRIVNRKDRDMDGDGLRNRVDDHPRGA